MMMQRSGISREIQDMNTLFWVAKPEEAIKET
jgi:hypothetical protein